MAMRLGTSKRLLTRYCNKLESIIAHLKSEKLETFTATQDEDSSIDNLRHLNEGIGAIRASTEKIEQLLREYATDVSGLQDLEQQELSSFEEYSARAEEVLASAFDYLVLLQSRRQAYSICTPRSNESSNLTTEPAGITSQTLQIPTRMASELPALPIPTFRGNIWEWDNFWELFNANVHSQPLPELYKFNYLKQAVRGEAYQAIEKFQVTPDNYLKAIQFLQHKYGNTQELVARLLDKLEKASLRSPSLKDQRSLFEELQAIIGQLAHKGEQVNSQWCIRKILSKFPASVQRKVLLKRNTISSEESSFTMDILLQFLEEIISNEEMVSFYMEKNEKEERNKFQYIKRDPPRQPNRSCMYCGKDHKSVDCTKYKTPQERSKYLRERKLCLICASAQHQTPQCKKRLCFKCQGPHHTSCCFKGLQSTATYERKVWPNNKKPKEEPKKGKPQREVHFVAEEPETKETAILQVNATPRFSDDTFLPTGELTVLDPRSNTLRKIAVLLDTGAEISFIDTALAEELQLPTIGKTKLHLHTFGSDQVSTKDCRKVVLNVWDDEGQRCSLSLLTHDILTKAFRMPELQDSDIQFIKSQRLCVNHSKQSVKPQVLLGADQLWSFVRAETSHIRLPSGLYLLSTRMGYLLTGQVERPPLVDTNSEEDRWNGYWSLEAQVNAVETVTDEEKKSEQDLWESFWKLDAAGTEEFGIAEKTQQEIVDKQVWDDFKRTIEKRRDGYYVRLPWKDPQVDLPDNKAIAYRRLSSLWNSLQKDENLLDQYNQIFQEQLRLNILEEVKGDALLGARVHYIPHQAVITPHKSTTKLRIVYDASAHYKGSPSLNDVLHRGPVILPLLYGILLRFRVGRIALISDVEKAFLQVRLHENDRDATRCLWLRNHKQAPSPSNIQTLRFTRVTFGLMPSPFLLAATTHYHLDQYKDSKLVKEIKENLYVDNLILCTDQATDAIQLYQTTKEMFRELSMNLREFVSNDQETMQAIACKDKSAELSPKVLGIKWNTAKDLLQLSCVMKSSTSSTKRNVASTIASVYDPMGYLTPLLHKPKVFLRSLWQQNFDWDTILPEKLTEEWEQIISEVDGFEKSISRALCSKGTKHEVITFADASSEAIATCVYLRSDDQVNLIIAKGKLPALKSTVTMPKMELNAATLAMRVTNAAVTQLQSVVKITQTIVLSDSEIALQWIKSNPQKGVGRMITSRLAEIRKIVKNLEELGCQVWFAHVPSSTNPADCATRGLSKKELLNHFWWTGPAFLRGNMSEWKDITLFQQKALDDEEETATATNMCVQHSENPDLLIRLKRYPLKTIRRIMAYLLRYIRISVAKANKKGKHSIVLSSWLQPAMIIERRELSGPEITVATKALIKLHQKLITPEMIRTMRHLNIKSDEESFLRCHGRLGKSEMSQSAKQPLIILQNTWLAESIIRESHNKGHASINHTMSLVRENYWIPKLRAQVTRIIRRCVPCQKFNNLPYKYPEQSDLPRERVCRARPFEHVGLDYFGPLTVALADGTNGKCYGCIITCMVTRLIHLDIAHDLSTKAFLLLLRRFFGRRGVPRTITSDNAPNFLLGETILKESYEAAKSDPSITRELSDKEIVWKHITPYAPWQGGFYERLIKSVKLSLYKTIGNQTLFIDDLSTVIIEIEAILNTRPLLYMETDSLNEIALRPIDFLQNEIEMAYPVDPPKEEEEDPSYVASDELALLRTKKQTVDALRSSCQAVEKFWQVWHTHYLTSLREKHQREVGKKKASLYQPKKGDIVMISDPVQPRQTWKLGRISELVTNSSGITREAVVILPSHHKIRRPVNLLVPLELEEYSDTGVPDTNEVGSTATTKETHNNPYNLRPNRKKNYNESTLDTSVVLIAMIGLLFVPQGTKGEKIPARDLKTSRLMKCIPGGIQLISEVQVPYQVCVEEFCKTLERPEYNETIRFPPEIVLHEHKVQWKLSINNAIEILETTCPSAPFCESIACFFCTSLIFNPECWPVGAIVALALAIYLLLTGCYVLLYIPLVVGKPLRVLFYGIFVTLRYLLQCCKKKRREERRSRRRSLELAHLLTIMMIMQSSPAVSGCQTVDIISHSSTLCTNSDGSQVCKIQLSEILKLNPFKREACFRLMKNQTTIHQIRASWRNLRLTCEKVTDYFTRDTIHNIVDSKRCPHVGSCIGSKCAQINSTSVIPELEAGNGFPGNTYCVESCGGPGCDCFYWSSGCLFYRIYLTPTSPRVYEIFHCNRWAETVLIDFTHFDAKTGKTMNFTALMLPNVPIRWKGFSFTLSTVSMTPMPILRTSFISDGNQTALWDAQVATSLRCESKKAAETLQCDVNEDCTCNPAETKANCKCLDTPIAQKFDNFQRRLPVILPSITFEESKHGTVNANVQNMVSTEVIVSLQEELHTDIIVDSDICTVENTELVGCYNCEKGAYAKIKCFASKSSEAEIVCDSTSFTAPCGKHGIESIMRISATQAMMRMKCSVSCGEVVTKFEVGGILKYTATFQTVLYTWLTGSSRNDPTEIKWPDFFHLFNVFSQWYKTVLITGLTLVAMLIFTYFLISTCGVRIILMIIKVLLKAIRFIYRLSWRLIFWIVLQGTKGFKNNMHAKRKF